MSRTNGWWKLFALLTCMGLMGIASADISAQISGIPIVLRPRPLPTDFVEISAGDYHTCARQWNGNVYCWGRNDLGQIGIGYSSGPLNTMRFVMNARQIDAGTDHTCALDWGGAAWCWGYNGAPGQFGALGANDHMQAAGAPGADQWPSPIPVDGGLAFNAIGAGRSSTCAVGMNGLFCWGGLATPPGAAGRASPLLIDSFGAFQRPAVGAKHACAVAFGSAFCVGDNSFGQLARDPNQLIFTFQPPTFLGWPISALFSSPVTRVATQMNFTCAEVSGQLQCAGQNWWGQLGNGNRNDTFQPQTVRDAMGNAVALRGVSTGHDHACALDASGAAFCWGYNGSGQVGNGTYGSWSHFTSAQAVAGGFTFREIAAGRDHTCGIATTNVIYCWGSNSYGQLGAGRSATQSYGALRFLTAPSPWDPVR